MKQIALLLIRIYQVCLGPFIGNTCKFHPSCSNYSHQAIQKFGFISGLWLSIKRLAKCNPWHPGGIDEV